MTKPNTHILVCASFRASGSPQGVCAKKGSQDLLAYLETELADRGMNDVAVAATGCLKGLRPRPRHGRLPAERVVRRHRGRDADRRRLGRDGGRLCRR